MPGVTRQGTSFSEIESLGRTDTLASTKAPKEKKYVLLDGETGICANFDVTGKASSVAY